MLFKHGLAVLAGAGALVALAGAGAPVAAAAPQAHGAAGLTARPAPGGRMAPAMGNPPVLFQRISGRVPAAARFSCQSASAVPSCYGPAQIRRAYDIPARLTGAGQTIVIVDAFSSPTIASDLRMFDKTFGLPNPKLTIIAPGGLTPFNPADPDQVGWSGEITLDVEWAHAIAPKAAIDLVLARSDADADLYTAQKYAISHNLGAALSQSFGEGESCMSPALMTRVHSLFITARTKKISVFASSGDTGAAQPDCDGSGSFFLSAATPASDPLVTAVGGTHLNAKYPGGAYQSETAWNDSGSPATDFGATGGGFSTVYGQPAWQHGLPVRGQRGVPDVAYSADVNGGVLVAWGSSGQGPGFFVFGGTSAGSPQWAAIATLADQQARHRLGFLNPALYAIAAHPGQYRKAFHDITTGSNSWDISGVAGYPAARGWDPVTGLGTPDVAHLISLLS
jgi:subtilase family serine protease